jgi:hypothetical protein
MPKWPVNWVAATKGELDSISVLVRLSVYCFFIIVVILCFILFIYLFVYLIILILI